MFGPRQDDSTTRKAIWIAWVMLPHEKKNFDKVERVVREIFGRAIENFRRDGKTFGHGL